MEEDVAFHPPTCVNCARELVSIIKTEMIKNILIGVVLMIVGMFHSHPIGQETLSMDDIEYIHSVFDNMPDSVTELYFPIVIPKSHIIAYKAIRKNHGICIEKDSVIIKEAEL